MRRPANWSARTLLAAAILLAVASAAVAEDELVLPSGAVERAGSMDVTYRLDTPASGRGRLRLDWTDTDDRLVQHSEIRFVLAHGTDVTVPLDLRRAVTMRNLLHARISFDGIDARGRPYHHRGDADRAFIARPPADWSDYQIVMWQRGPVARYRALRRLGISAGMAQSIRDPGRETFIAPIVEPLIEADLPWYVENIATDFYSAYHRYFPDRPLNWLFLEAQRRHHDNPHDLTAFVREPSLSDPVWLARIAERLKLTVQAHQPFRPLFYDLADEAGIAELVAPWDFDRSTASLAGMRDWLRQRYGSLEALNRQWETDFADWNHVLPATTDEAMARPGDNFSAWADFKEWMDEAFACAVRAGTDAVHAADPDARAALAGAQIPGWGYDYNRLAHAVDVMEVYDYWANVEILRSLNPDIAIFTTSFGSGLAETHLTWREWLRGSRGLILWDDPPFLGPDDKPTPRAIAAAGPFAELRHGLGALLINSVRQVDPVDILYSPESERVRWMLDWRPRGQAWSEPEAQVGPEADFRRRLPETYARLVKRIGLQHRFVSSDGLEHGALERDGARLLILTDAIALSDAAVQAIRHFAAQGGAVIANTVPGIFDEHGRKRADSPLAGLGMLLPPETLRPEADPAPRLAQLFRAAGVASEFAVLQPSGAPDTEVETYVFHNGGITLLALLRLRAGDEAKAEAGRPMVLALPRPAHVYDVRAGVTLGQGERFAFRVDPISPLILAIADAPLPPPRLMLPARLRLGATAAIAVTPASATPAERAVLRLQVIDPTGQAVPHYSGNLLAPNGQASAKLPLALNDRSGTWTVRVTDVLSGQSAEKRVVVTR